MQEKGEWRARLEASTILSFSVWLLPHFEKLDFVGDLPCGEF